MKNICVPMVFSLIMALLASCHSEEDEVKNKNQSSAPKIISKVVGVARIEPEKGLLYIYASASGKISEINENENHTVVQGTCLLKLDKTIDIAQLNMEKSKVGVQKSVIQSAEANAKAIYSEFEKMKADVALNEKLFAAKAITQQMVDDSKAKLSKLNFEYDKQLAEVSQSKNKMAEIASGIQYRNAVLDEKQVNAPYNGSVLEWNVQKGDYVNAGQKLGQFAAEGSVIAVTEVDELFADKIKIGMRAEIISQATGKKLGEGQVYFIAGFLKRKSLFSDENTVEDRRVEKVKIRLNSGARVMINNRVDCIIYLN